MIKIGSNSVNAIYFRSSAVDRLYYNGEMIWPDGDCATKVTYVDGTEETFKIKGKLTSSSIDNILDVIEVEIGLDVTSIGGYAFYNCSELTSVTIPDSVTSIDWNAFENCSSLTNVTIPDSVRSIGAVAFGGCSSLTSVTISNGVMEIESWAFASCTSLTSVIIPDSVTSIGRNAFECCSGLSSMTIPDSVTSIGGSAFWNCTELTSVTFEGFDKSTTKSMITIDYIFGEAFVDLDTWELIEKTFTVNCTDGSFTVTFGTD